MKREVIVGIDPGWSGAVAAVTLDGQGIIVKDLVKEDLKKMWEIFDNICQEYTVKAVFLEKVQGVRGQGVGSISKFMQQYGMWQGVLVTYSSFGFELVRPQIWQASLGCLSRGDKRVTKAKADELFPLSYLTHRTADAALIAEYGRRKIGGKL